MTQEEAKEAIKVMSAYVNGKTIQYLDDDGRWVDTPNPVFDWSRWEYRVNPESKYRPFKDKAECWQEMQKHHPFGWVIDKLENFQHLALVYSCDTNSCDSDNGDRVGLSVAAISIDFEQMLKEFKFADGTPFGIKEQT